MKLHQTAAGLFFLCVILAYQVSGHAGTAEEIASLLQYVEQSECTFIRNDKHYTGVEARGHIEFKYDYFKDRIATTEDFIQHAATRSVMSGKFYTVRCNGEEMNLADWLHAELDRLRTR